MPNTEKHTIHIFFEEIPVEQHEDYPIFLKFINEVQNYLNDEYRQINIVVHNKNAENRHPLPNTTIMKVSLGYSFHNGNLALQYENSYTDICQEIYKSIYSYVTSKEWKNILTNLK